MSDDAETAFYDAEGKLIFWYQGGVLDAPEGAVYQAEVSGVITADTWFDVNTKKLKHKTPFPVKVAQGKITGIPKGTIAFVDGELSIITSGKLTTTNPEGMVVRLMHFKHVMQDIVIPK